MRAPVLIICALALTACGPRTPDKSLILWEQPSPELASYLHASEIQGRAFVVMPTGSMEPFLTAGDHIVADMRARYDAIKAGDLVVYQANWLPADSPIVAHMAASKVGDEWIMDGIANRHYERGTLRMTRADFRGKVVQVYTKRKKP